MFWPWHLRDILIYIYSIGLQQYSQLDIGGSHLDPAAVFVCDCDQTLFRCTQNWTVLLERAEMLFSWWLSIHPDAKISLTISVDLPYTWGCVPKLGLRWFTCNWEWSLGLKHALSLDTTFLVVRARWYIYQHMNRISRPQNEELSLHGKTMVSRVEFVFFFPRRVKGFITVGIWYMRWFLWCLSCRSKSVGNPWSLHDVAGSASPRGRDALFSVISLWSSQMKISHIYKTQCSKKSLHLNFPKMSCFYCCSTYWTNISWTRLNHFEKKCILILGKLTPNDLPESTKFIQNFVFKQIAPNF